MSSRENERQREREREWERQIDKENTRKREGGERKYHDTSLKELMQVNGLLLTSRSSAEVKRSCWMKDRFLSVEEKFGDIFQIFCRTFNASFNLGIHVHDGKNDIKGRVINHVRLIPNKDNGCLLILAQVVAKKGQPIRGDPINGLIIFNWIHDADNIRFVKLFNQFLLWLLLTWSNERWFLVLVFGW